MENDPSINSQAQETTVTASTTEEAQTLNPASGPHKDHPEVEAIDSGSDRADGPDETNSEEHPKDKTEQESNQSFQDGEQGCQQSPESVGEEPLHPEPSPSPRDEAGGEDAHLEGSSAALPEEASDRPGASQEPPAVDPQDSQNPGPSSAGLEGQETLRRRLLVPGERTP